MYYGYGNRYIRPETSEERRARLLEQTAKDDAKTAKIRLEREKLLLEREKLQFQLDKEKMKQKSRVRNS